MTLGAIPFPWRTATPQAAHSALVIGGDAMHQRFCESLLQTLGAAVLVAPTCREGLQALTDASFALVIVDEGSAVRDGAFWGCLQDLVARLRRQSLYVVTDRGARLRRPVWASVARTMPKPVRAIDLVDAITRLPR